MHQITHCRKFSDWLNLINIKFKLSIITFKCLCISLKEWHIFLQPSDTCIIFQIEFGKSSVHFILQFRNIAFVYFTFTAHFLHVFFDVDIHSSYVHFHPFNFIKFHGKFRHHFETVFFDCNTQLLWGLVDILGFSYGLEKALFQILNLRQTIANLFVSLPYAFILVVNPLDVDLEFIPEIHNSSLHLILKPILVVFDIVKRVGLALDFLEDELQFLKLPFDQHEIILLFLHLISNIHLFLLQRLH